MVELQKSSGHLNLLKSNKVDMSQTAMVNCKIHIHEKYITLIKRSIKCNQVTSKTNIATCGDNRSEKDEILSKYFSILKKMKFYLKS